MEAISICRIDDRRNYTVCSCVLIVGQSVTVANSGSEYNGWFT